MRLPPYVVSTYSALNRIFEFTKDGIVSYALALAGLSVIPLEYMCNR